MPTETRANELALAARQEARRMIEMVAPAEVDHAVTMTVGQFRILAQLIAGLADAATPEGRFDAPIDGVNFWVPLHYLQLERERFARTLAAQAPAAGADRFVF